MSIPSPLLYHYTSGSNLLGIFNNNCLWATNIHYMSDYNEFAHAISMAILAIRQLQSQSVEERMPVICDAVIDRLERSSRLSIYVACFSEVRDSLSQWRGYCPPSFGYSIGFDGVTLRRLAKMQGFDLKQCIYEHQQQREMIASWAKEILTFIAKSCPKDVDIKIFCETSINEHMYLFYLLAPYLKNQAFQDEREWRLISLVPSNDARLKLRSGSSMLIPYVPIDLDLSKESSLIWDICVGPTPHTELAMSSLSHLSNKVKIVNGISRTAVPYRDW